MKFLVLTVLFAALAITAVPAQVVQLKSGRVLVGVVSDPDESGFTIQRLDNGGVLDLSWGQLSSHSATRLKTLVGLSVDEEGEVMVPAVEIGYELTGGGIEQVTGRIVEETDTTVTVRRQGLRYPIERKQVRSRRDVEVPVSDIYSTDQFYNEKLAEFAPGEDADKHILLGDLLVRVRDYEHAEFHYHRADELGGGMQRSALEGKIKRLALFRDSAAERDLLDTIRVSLARKQFDKGLAAIEDYEQRYPKGKLRAEFARIQQRFEAGRASFLVGRVTSVWKGTMNALARRKSTEAGVGFDAAKDYAESQMGQDIRARVAQALGLSPEEVDDFWVRRFEFRGGPHADRYSFGIGSWTLGTQAILKDTKQGRAAASQEQGSSDRELERTTRRIREAQERARRSQTRQRQGGESEAVTPESWWEDARPEEKLVWLRAYYAEFSGDMKIVSAHLEDCTTCGGQGKLTYYSDVGEPKNTPCTTCHGTRYKRWIRAH